MVDFYRGSTPTFIFTPTVPIPQGTPAIIFSQGRTLVQPTVTVDGNQYKCTLTSSQTSAFNINDPVTAMLYFATESSVTSLAAHTLTVGENYYDFQEAEEEPNPDVHLFELVDDMPDDNPSSEGWYELVNGEYVLSVDTVPNPDKEYYLDVVPYFESNWLPVVSDPTYNPVDNNEIETGDSGDSPALDGWYELVGGKYVLSTDSEPVAGKAYYVLDVNDDFEDEYDEFASTFDGDAFAKDMDVEETWEDDLDEEDYDIWLEDEVFIEADNVDDYDITYEVAYPAAGSNPMLLGLLEIVDDEYEFTEDEVVEPGKTYYDMVVTDPEEGE